MKIRIGTRKSKLALAQTKLFIKELKKHFPETDAEIIHISTTGDKIQNRSLAEIGGKGVFVSEIEKALLENRIDIAVHSAKDLPVKLAEGLEISGVLKRGDYRDALILREGSDIINSSDFVIGTGSPRRRKNMLRLYPDISFKDIRGNIDTRLRKLSKGEYDGIILAMAGLERLKISGKGKYIIYPFYYKDFMPSACQGIIAIESLKKSMISEIIKKYINHADTFACFEAERRVLEVLGADCTSPAGVYSEIQGEYIFIAVSANNKFFAGATHVSNHINFAESLAEDL